MSARLSNNVIRSSCDMHCPPTNEVDMTTQEKVSGPASYFPSIEKKYGKPIAHRLQVLEEAGPLKHMQLVSLLKTEHQLGHGHANALVAWFVAHPSSNTGK